MRPWTRPTTGQRAPSAAGPPPGPYPVGANATLPARHPVLDAVLRTGGIASVYQPIVLLEGGGTVAFEALARASASPTGPEELFRVARAGGRLAELDLHCQRAAVVGARRADLRMPLFVNIEPEAAGPGSLDALLRADAASPASMPLVLEITERALTARPCELIDLLARARSLGWGIALDDVGRDPRSLALLPIVRPDVVKLDRVDRKSVV